MTISMVMTMMTMMMMMMMTIITMITIIMMMIMVHGNRWWVSQDPNKLIRWIGTNDAVLDGEG